MNTDRDSQSNRNTGQDSGPLNLPALDGEADYSELTRTLYATDASIYRVEPAGVVWPASTADVRRTLRFARETGTSVVARGAGSSLTGNAVGEGIILDCSRNLDEIVSVNLEAKTATVQPGAVLDELNDTLADYGLYFSPDPSTLSTCTIGGMVANDAAGPHSVRHGTTWDNVIRVKCAPPDSTTATFDHRTSGRLASELAHEDRVGELYRMVGGLATDHAANLDAVDADVVAAGGASCSRQLADCDIETRHPMELLAEVVV